MFQEREGLSCRDSVTFSFHTGLGISISFGALIPHEFDLNLKELNADLSKDNI